VDSLPLFKDERELISKSIAPRLKESYYNVRVGVRLRAKHQKLSGEDALSREELEISHPLSPDIDILYWKKDYSGEPVLNAVEIKYFRYDKNRLICPALYDGIGEALLLCTYGVDYVHLWHFFDPEIPNEIYSNYKNTIESIMNNIYTINYKSELLRYQTLDKKDIYDTTIEMYDILDTLKEFLYIKSLKSNVLRYDNNAKTIRTLIKRAYRIVNK